MLLRFPRFSIFPAGSLHILLVLASLGLASPTAAAVPVITSPSVLDVYYNPEDRSGVFFAYLITATDAPKSFGATGLPPGTTVDASSGIVLGDPSRPGVTRITVSATNDDGTGTASVDLRVHPAVIGVRSTAGTYTVGDQIHYQLTFNTPVFITGTPYLSANGRAEYASGSGGTEILFVHTVAASDPAVDETQITGLHLNGGTIRSSEGLDAGLVLPLRFHRTFVRITQTATLASATLSAQVGVAFSYTLQASFAALAPTYAAAPLPPGVSLNSSTGVLAGTPTVAGTFVVNISATAPAGGPAAQGTLTVIIAPPNEPPSPPPPPPPPPPPAPPPPLLAQTVSLSAAGPILVGQPVMLRGIASSGLPVVLFLVSGNATLQGSTLTVLDSAPVTVRAVQSGGNGYAEAETVGIFVAGRASQSVDFVSPVSAIVIGQPIRLSATASSDLPVTFLVVSGSATISGDTLTVTGPGPVVIRALQPGNERFAAASTDITLTDAQRAAQSLEISGLAEELRSDRTLTLAARSSSGLPVTLQLVSGPATLVNGVLTPRSPTGTVVVRATQPGSEVYAPMDLVRTLTIRSAGRLVNLSSRLEVTAADPSKTLIAGFVVAGPAPKRLLIRAIGPALSDFGIAAPLADPELIVYDQSGRILAQNDNWSGDTLAQVSARVGAFALRGGSRDAALLITLEPGAYSLHVAAKGGRGVALAEVYDASDEPALEPQHLVNLSTRGEVGVGEGVVAAGWVVTGEVPKQVLIRGVGPGLRGFGVSSSLDDPLLRVFRGAEVLAENDNWTSARAIPGGPTPSTGAAIAEAAAAAGAFPLAAGSNDAALILTLPPGAYTAVLSGNHQGTGAGLVEIYELPSSP